MAKNNKQKVKDALKRAKDKVIDKTSDVLSAPKRKYYESKSRGAKKRYKAFKRVNDLNKSGVRGTEEDDRVREVMREAQRKALRKS